MRPGKVVVVAVVEVDSSCRSGLDDLYYTVLYSICKTIMPLLEKINDQSTTRWM